MSDLSAPWYKRPGPLAGVIAAAIAVIGLGTFLAIQLLDDDGPSTVTILRFDRLDDQGTPVVRELTATVRGQAGAEVDFLWLRPANSFAPEPAVTMTDASNGRAEFQWGPTNDVSEPELWTSGIELTEVFLAEESLAATEFECTYERRGEPVGRTRLAVSFSEPADLRGPRVATYSFPDHSFLAGEVMECVVASGEPVPVGSTSTTPAETTTTTADTTTTVADTTTTSTSTSTTTTVPEATTTVAETTTTAAETTTTAPAETTTTVADERPSMMEAIDARPELSRTAELIRQVGLDAQLSDPAATLTVYAPTNDAWAAFAGDTTDDAVVSDLLLAHVHTAAALEAIDVLALPNLTMANGSVQAISAPPPSIGGAAIVALDIPADNGFLNTIDTVLDPTATG